MTPKQKWLLERLLFPAGILPPGISLADLKYNEESRQNIGNIGFEYFYLLTQNPQELNKSAIGRKIRTLHAPWPEFPHQSVNKPVVKHLYKLLVLRDKKITKNFLPMAQQSLKFAADIGAKLVTFHVSFFNQADLPHELEELSRLSLRYKVEATIEAEGPYIRHLKDFRNLAINGSFAWCLNPKLLLDHLDKISSHKFNLTFDTASLIGEGLPLIDIALQVFSRISHVHLAGSVPGKDTAGEIDSPEIIKFVRLLYLHQYQGFITAEVNSTTTNLEILTAQIYGASSFLHLPILKTKAVRNAQIHLENSAHYLLSHLK